MVIEIREHRQVNRISVSQSPERHGANCVWNKSAAAVCYWLCFVFWPCLLTGQTNTPAVTYPANRYLLVVETSNAMRRRADAMAQSVRDLFASAVASQARRGDSLGVWTFNEDVYTGLLPLQQLSPETL